MTLQFIQVEASVFDRLEDAKNRSLENYSSWSEFLSCLLDDNAILRSENDRLCDIQREIEQRAAAQLAASEARVRSLEQIEDNLHAERAELIKKLKALESQQEQLEINERKYKADIDTLNRKLCRSEADCKSLCDTFRKKETFLGKIHNLFA